MGLFCKMLVLTASCHHVSEGRHYSSVYQCSNRTIVVIGPRPYSQLKVKSKILEKLPKYNFRLKANNSLNIMTDHPNHLSEYSHKGKSYFVIGWRLKNCTNLLFGRSANVIKCIIGSDYSD